MWSHFTDIQTQILHFVMETTSICNNKIELIKNLIGINILFNFILRWEKMVSCSTLKVSLILVL